MTDASTPAGESLELLAINEETVGRLYSAYADRFPESRDFWRSLAQQERGHAASIRTLKNEYDGGRLRVSPDRFKAAAIRLSIKHTEAEIDTATSAYMKPVNALSIAAAIEQSLLEARFFDVFGNDSLEISQLLQKLSDDTREHARVILERWRQAKSDR